MKSPAYLKKISPGPVSEDEFIDDICKYCDRWCERCKFTSGCLSYVRRTKGQHAVNDAPLRDINDSFSADELMRREMARELNADVPTVDSARAEAGTSINSSFFRDPLSSYAWKVSSGIYNWLHAIANGGGQERVKLMKADLSGKIDCLKALDVIDYYLFVAVARLENAVRCSDDRKESDRRLENAVRSSGGRVGANHRPADSNGLAKTAVLSIERIMEALAVIIKEFPEHEDCILNFLIRLSRVISKTEKRFSATRSFIRPGLDE
ncbi:MAG: hypothetical protein U5K32_13360 [Bacteroidales bacterium]|nr:hypothetical protein [Bacteroidales bacterium]